MTASIILREFEIAAFRAQNNSPSSALVFQSDTPSDTLLTVSERLKRVNQKTWDVFRACLIHTIGGEKFSWICRQYQFDYQKIAQEGRPLLAEHVELFSIGASQQFTRDIKRLLPTSIKIKQLSRSVLNDMLQKAQPFGTILGKYLDPIHISGVPSEFRAWFLNDPILKDREKQLLLSDAQHLSFEAFLERFSKSIVNRELQEKQIIPVPGHDGRPDFYRVYRKISTGHGLVAYALKPAALDSSLKPLLVFRPTQMAPSGEDAFPSYFNDLESAVGKSGYQAAKASLERLINHSSFLSPNTMLDIAGYSLGGSHAQHFLADYHSRVSSAHFYSDPSIDVETVERFAREIQVSHREEDPIKISIYRVVGDFCTYVGKQHIGCNVDPAKVKVELIEVNHENREIREVAALSLHAFKLFDNTPQMDYRILRVDNPQELSNRLDNTKRGPEVIWYERMRQIWGKVVYAYLFLLYALLQGFGKIFGVHLLRSSQQQ